MKLQTKFTIWIVLTALVAGAGIFIFANMIFLRDYQDLERDIMSTNLKITLSTIDERIKTLDTLATDWAVWDDTYSFADNKNEGFIKSNCNESSFAYLGVNAIIIEKTSGEIVLAKGFDLEKGKEYPISPGLRQYLADSIFADQMNNNRDIKGIIALPEGPMMIASHSILTSEGKGPSRGAVIMGRYVDNILIQEIIKTTQLPINILAQTDQSGSGLVTNEIPALTKENPLFIEAKEGKTIQGYALLTTVTGRPNLIVKIETPQAIYSQGKASIKWLLLSIALVAMILILVNLLFLNRAVVYRLQYLGISALRIARRGDFSSEITFSGHDEIALLAGQMNEMLAKLSETQNSLKESENRYSTLVEKSSDGIMIIQDNLVKYANDKMLQMLGRPIQDVLQQPFVNFVDSKHILTAGDYYYARMAGKQVPEMYEIGIIDRDRQIVSAEISAKVVEINGSRCDMMVVRDISERKRVEASLKESEEKYRNLFENAHDMIHSVDLSGKIIYANRSWMDTLGYDASDLPGLNIFQIVHPDSLSNFKELFGRVINGENVRHIEAIFLTKDNRKVFVEGNSTGRYMDGKMIATQSIFRDITERKMIESKILEQKELIDSILANTPNVVLVVNKKLQIILGNKASSTFFDMEIGNLENKNIRDLPILTSMIPEINKTIRNKLTSHQFEFKTNENGHSKLFSVSINLMPKDTLLLNLQDITEERERLEKLYLTDRLASVGEMAAGVAHELNNPLTSITMLSQLLVKDELPEEDKGDLLVINSEAKRAASIVKNLLTFSRKHASERQPFQINRVLEDVLKLRNYEHKSDNIQVITNFDDHLPDVMIDYFQMQQVFLNLILNAEQAMAASHQRGTLTVVTGRSNNNIKVSIIDDGPGISEENIRKLFTPFFTTKEVGKGTGLGLSISYGIVKSHGGRIYVDSYPNKGATFTVELPIDARRES